MGSAMWVRGPAAGRAAVQQRSAAQCGVAAGVARRPQGAETVGGGWEGGLLTLVVGVKKVAAGYQEWSRN